MPLSTSLTPFARGARGLDATRLRALDDVLPPLYAETDLARLPERCVETLARLVPAESHGIVVHDRAAGRRWWHLRPAAPEHAALVPGFFANFHEFTPATYRRTSGTGEALALSDFVGRRRLGSLAIYTDYYRPLGLEDDLNINVTFGDVTICAAALRSSRGFRRDEREVMNALRPHLRQAWLNAHTFAAAHSRHDAMPLRAERWTPDQLEACFGLTPREADVLLWVAQGKTNPEVATILGIRRDTVRAHLERIFLKLGVETRHAATLRAIEALGAPR